jgi:SOS-response transcriptional repressor LexA
VQVLAFVQARMSRAGWVPSDRKIMTHQGVTERAIYRLVRALQRQGALSSARHHCRIGLSLEDVPSVGLPLIGRVVAVAPIFTVEHLDRTLKIHRL